MLTTASLPAADQANPYQSPSQTGPICELSPENPWGFAQRTGLYLLTGVVLYIGFCSPLDFVYGNLFAHEAWIGNNPLPFVSLVLASLIAGLAVEPLVRRQASSAVVALVFVLLASIVSFFLTTVLENVSSPHALERIQRAAIWSLFLGPFGWLLCIHFVAPICCGAMWLAGRTVDATNES